MIQKITFVTSLICFLHSYQYGFYFVNQVMSGHG
jgi:hypothetical protein